MRTIKDNYSLPRTEQQLELLIGAEWFSTLDLKSEYLQEELTEEAQPSTTFTCGPLGFYECYMMPFGASNTPATFQRLMKSCLGDLNLSWCVVYLEDITVIGETTEDHLQTLTAVFKKKLRQAKLKLRSSKCNFFRTQISYLGHLVSKEGITTGPGKIDTVKNWPKPKTRNDIRHFLGFVGYCRKFIKNFSSIARLLNDLLQGQELSKKVSKRKLIEWGPEQQMAFEELKEACCVAPVLAYTDYTQPFILHADSSIDGLGALLYQKV